MMEKLSYSAKSLKAWLERMKASLQEQAVYRRVSRPIKRRRRGPNSADQEKVFDKSKRNARRRMAKASRQRNRS